MHRHVHPEVVHHPVGHGVEFFVAVVIARDQQRGQFEPDPGLVAQVAQGIQHRRQMSAADPVVEVLGECLQIHVGRIH